MNHKGRRRKNEGIASGLPRLGGAAVLPPQVCSPKSPEALEVLSPEVCLPHSISNLDSDLERFIPKKLGG